MDAFPAFFPLRGRTVVVAGEGEAAEAKLRLLARSPASVVRLTGDAASDPAAYAGAILAFVASADPAFAAAAAAAVRAARVPLNVVDRPDLCDFTTPSVIDRGEVVAAIGTGGASPMLATLLRHDIEQRLPEGAGRVAALFRRMQDEVRNALPDLSRRRAFLRRALGGPAAAAVQAGDMEAAARLLRADLQAGVEARGRLAFLRADGPVDLLSLRAVRALAAADAVAADPAVADEVLDLARRDAERLTPGQALDAVVAGGFVVRLLAGPASAAELEALSEAGLSPDMLPVAAA